MVGVLGGLLRRYQVLGYAPRIWWLLLAHLVFSRGARGPIALVPPAHLQGAASPTNIVDSQGSVRGGHDLQTAGSNDHGEIQDGRGHQDLLHTASSTRRSRSPRATKSVSAHDDEICEIHIDYFEINGLPGRLVASVINDY